jgi:hypothetical protein
MGSTIAPPTPHPERASAGRTAGRAPIGPVRASPTPLGQLQRSLGNRNVHRLLLTRAVQAKLTVGPVDDDYEREADRVARQVMRMPDRSAEVAPRPPLHIQRMCAECEEEEDALHRSSVQREGAGAVPEVSGNLESYIGESKGRGRSLSPATRAFFEPRFGRPFGDVRVHTDARANQASSEIRARAFTTGSDIYFASGQYAPGSTAGDRLLGHELTHVVQQHASVAPLRRDPDPAGSSKVEQEYSRGNDDQWECCYETAQIKVGLVLDTSKCAGNKKAQVPTTVTYAATLGGKTEELDASAPVQGTTEGPQHFLMEAGNPKNKVNLVAGNPRGPDPGNSLTATLAVKNPSTCGDTKGAEGCVFVDGTRGVQQHIKWKAVGTKATSIEAVQRPQKKEEGTNRLPAGLPLLKVGGYPKFAAAQPRDGNCWCDPKTGYHMNYADGKKCPAKYRVNGGVNLPDNLKITKKRPKSQPEVCKPGEATKVLCDSK